MTRASPSACLVAIMRDEGPHVLEWVAHHRAAGFDRILVFTNDCSDGTDRILDRLMALGHVIHAPNPKQAFGQLGVWQVAALRYAAQFGAYRESDWALTLDADEFLDISAGRGTLADLVAAAPAFDLMSLSVVPFGCNGIDGIGEGRVHGRFARPRFDLSALAGGIAPPTAVKTLMRPGLPGALFRNHRPRIDGFSGSPHVWVNGSGAPMPPAFTDRKINLWSAEGALELAHVDHYALRSRESFLLKCLRGDAVTAGRLGLGTDEQLANAIAYWDARQGAAEAPHRPNLPPEAEGLREAYLADGALASLHAQALDHHRRSLGTILKTQAGARLAEHIGYRRS